MKSLGVPATQHWIMETDLHKRGKKEDKNMEEEQKEKEELLEVPINIWRQQADLRTICELFWSRFRAHFIIQKLCGYFKFFLKKKRHVHRVHRFIEAIDISLFLFYCQKLILTEPASSFSVALPFLLEQLKTQSNTDPKPYTSSMPNCMCLILPALWFQGPAGGPWAWFIFSSVS